MSRIGRRERGAIRVIGQTRKSDLTPTERKAIEVSIDTLKDMWIPNIVDLDKEETTFDKTYFAPFLPRVFQHKYNAATARSLLGCLMTVAWKFRDSKGHLLSCTGEELVMHAIIQQAKAVLETDKGRPIRDDAFGNFEDLAFEDTDVEMLFDPKLDGIEKDEEIKNLLGIENLEYEKWFMPFRDWKG